MAGPNRPTVFLGPTPEFPTLMTDQLTFMRANRTMTDFTITAQGDETKLQCHKLVLAIHSLYLRAMFESEMLEAATNTVHYDDFSLDTMRIVIDYCYHEQVEFPDDQLMPLIEASDYLQIERLNKRCINEVKTFMTPENVLQYLTFAVKHSLKEVKSWCMDMIVKSFPDVSVQPAFKVLTLAEVKECLTAVVRADMHSDAVLNAVFRWIVDNVSERGQLLEELLQQVNLNNCSLSVILNLMEVNESIIATQVKVPSLLTKAIKHIAAQVQKSTEEAKAKPLQRKLVVVGGQMDEVNPDCWTLDTEENKLLKLCSIPFKELQKKHSICAIPEGFALTGGEDSDLCVVFVASTKSWRKMPSMMRKRCRHASICIEGIVFILCGTLQQDLLTVTASVDCLTMENGEWEALPNSLTAMIWPKVAELNGKIFLLDARTTSELLEFDVKKKVWRKLTPIPTEKSRSLSMTAINDKLFVAGGTGRKCAWYDPAIDTWCMAKNQPTMNHRFGSFVQIDNITLLLLGGDFNTGTDAIEEFNLADESWCVKDLKIPAKLWGHQALYLDIPQE